MLALAVDPGPKVLSWNLKSWVLDSSDSDGRQSELAQASLTAQKTAFSSLVSQPRPSVCVSLHSISHSSASACTFDRGSCHRLRQHWKVSLYPTSRMVEVILTSTPH